MKYLVTPAIWSMDVIVATSMAHDCPAAYVGVPPKWEEVGAGWDLAVVVEVDENDVPISATHVDPVTPSNP